MHLSVAVTALAYSLYCDQPPGRKPGVPYFPGIASRGYKRRPAPALASKLEPAKAQSQSEYPLSTNEMGLDGKVRVVLVGDTACGKTSLAVRLSQNIFIDYHCPTDYVEDFSAEIGTRKGTRGLTILDTSSDDSVRSLAYKCCDAVVVCFDLTDSSTLESVENKWLPELEENCPGVPFILAGCKRDEMCDGPEGCECGGACCDLNEKELVAFLSRSGASAYIDCSALTGENVEVVFGLAAECTVPKRKNSAKRLVASIKKRLSHL